MKQEIIKIIHKDLWNKENKSTAAHDLLVVVSSGVAIILIIKDKENLTNAIIVFGVFGIIYFLLKNLAKIKLNKLKESLLNKAKEKELSLGIYIGVKVKHVNGYRFQELQEAFLIKEYKNGEVLLESLTNKFKQVPLKEIVKDYARIR